MRDRDVTITDRVLELRDYCKRIINDEENVKAKIMKLFDKTENDIAMFIKGKP